MSIQLFVPVERRHEAVEHSRRTVPATPSQTAHVMELSMGDILFNAGSLSRGLYYVVEGMIGAIEHMPDGQLRTLGHFRQCDTFGFTTNGLFAFTAMASAPARLLHFASRSLASDILLNGHRDRGSTKSALTRLALHAVRRTACPSARLAHYLLNAFDQSGYIRGNCELLDIRISPVIQGTLLGLPARIAGQLLAELLQREIIFLDTPNRIELIDRLALEKMALGTN